MNKIGYIHPIVDVKDVNVGDIFDVGDELYILTFQSTDSKNVVLVSLKDGLWYGDPIPIKLVVKYLQERGITRLPPKTIIEMVVNS